MKKVKVIKKISLIMVLLMAIAIFSACGSEPVEEESAISETEAAEEQEGTYTFTGTTGYTVELPNIYKEKVEIVSNETGDTFCFKDVYEESEGGVIFSINRYNASDEEYFSDMDIFIGSAENGKYYYSFSYPSDWNNIDPKYEDEYMKMMEYCSQIEESFDVEGFVHGDVPEGY